VSRFDKLVLTTLPAMAVAAAAAVGVMKWWPSRPAEPVPALDTTTRVTETPQVQPTVEVVEPRIVVVTTPEPAPEPEPDPIDYSRLNTDVREVADTLERFNQKLLRIIAQTRAEQIRAERAALMQGPDETLTVEPEAVEPPMTEPVQEPAPKPTVKPDAKPVAIPAAAKTVPAEREPTL